MAPQTFENTGVLLFATVVIVLLILIGIVSVVIGFASKERGARTGGVIVGAVCLLLGLVTWLFASFTIVQGYEVGVPVSFGKVGQPLKSGAHLVAPWTKVETFPTRPLAVPDVEIAARTSQGGRFTVTVGARWSVVPDKARELYFQVRTGDEGQISKAVVDKALGQAVGNVYSGMENADAISNRDVVEKKLTAELQRLVDPYGIQVNTLFLRAAEPDQATANAISAFTSQQQATRVATEAQQTAAADAKRRQIEADGIRSAAAGLPSGLTPLQLQALCMQAQERVATAAIAKGVPVYTLPCGTTTTAVAR